MRALFTTTAGSGHFHPLVPVARVLVEAGHEVAVAAPGSFGPTVEASGFRASPPAATTPRAWTRSWQG